MAGSQEHACFRIVDLGAVERRRGCQPPSCTNRCGAVRQLQGGANVRLGFPNLSIGANED